MKNPALKILCALAVSAAASSMAARAQSQSELNREACAQYGVEDERLNKVYAQILQEYKGDATFVASLRAAQRAWLAYREAHLEAMYPGPDKQLRYGSAYPMCRCYALAETTRERTEVLQRWVTGLDEGDVCGGSVKTRGQQARVKTRRGAKTRRGVSSL